MTLNQKNVGFQSVKRKTLSKQVVDQIVQLLQSGHFKPGDKLPSEPKLMEELYVSRPVLREAMSSLETLGIIRRKTREGTYFSERVGSEPFYRMLALSTGDFSAIIEARISIELGLITLAAEKITDEQLGKLKQTIEDMSEADDYSEHDKEFHRIIANSANNPFVEGLVDPLLSMVDQVLNKVSQEYKNREATVEQHIEVYNALKKRDVLEAYTKLREHLEYGRNKVMKIIHSRDVF
ncbi:FadR/GntR family transcriptional regulator [Halobacillus naozhouensis]|uniref:FadR/GntR family transcriptional regulator n=1 Tax=Halobacillus naozhouensis TaxID=554880 RepID=A0ABY8J0M2_9BACI|nr:FadR/GntR family transcriptional regulator [Halobacillus naozhouensis]WFT74436.1 FadR/GntR family transcriptional regulator [Halobacillus naozhouensis]